MLNGVKYRKQKQVATIFRCGTYTSAEISCRFFSWVLDWFLAFGIGHLRFDMVFRASGTVHYFCHISSCRIPVSCTLHRLRSYFLSQ